ncbi:hypothetical protein EMIHUDRAFT_460000 [Emiliania huxleyi CCMP1516]|uniref:FHA domain-containing protein n=2 Tax=Emiliania huxleyi TaxID=2903 RepID=A0A0D3IAG9_EMIH1|nr:hypothetical protein EMIHUDRAFT_460000 [Emiliania huxleyi CCMP1516]EOD08254.1 hypothetical protein EMIHUDRAFT_460000 [Emiliania huxleyi CCMP1516]|eukprot:XP_005760683.1 hypothetical protein EMIHUDRAFT_460000 [Emiliania huxleyi CCMP1516]
MPRPWGRLLFTGGEEGDATLRKVDLTEGEHIVGRRPECLVVYTDNRISSTHFKISLRNSSDLGKRAFDVCLEDCSANGTYLNAQLVGKGNFCFLFQRDEIGLLKPCGGDEQPPALEIAASATNYLLERRTADHFPFLATDATPQRAAKAVPPLSVSGLSSSGPTPLPTERASAASSSSNGTAKKRLGGIFGSRASSRCDTDEAATPPSEQHSLGAESVGDESLDLVSRQLAMLNDPSPTGMHTLNHTLQRGFKFQADAIALGGVTAFMDVIGATMAKPKKTAMDLQVLDIALDMLLTTSASEEGASSLLDEEGGFDKLVSVLSSPAQKTRSKALQLLACMVVYTDKPLVESSLRRANRYGGASPGVLLASLLRDKEGALPEAQTCTDVVTLLNALVACSGNPAALVDELSSAGVDDALTEIEPLFSSSPDLALQLRALHWKKVQPSGKGTLWASLPRAPPIDEAALRELFTQPALLDVKRSNQIQIALAKFKGRGILAAVLALDETVRKPRTASDDIARLRECSPSAEEAEMLSPFAEDPRLKETVRWGPAESFLLDMTTVPRLSQRLACFLSKLTFEQRKKDAEAQVEAINKAVQCLRGSKTLPLLLALVLQLAETKSTVSDARPAQTSLLHYVARVAPAESSKQLRLELRDLEEAATLSSAGVAEELDGLCKELDALGSELSSPEYGGKGDGFVAALGSWRGAAAEKVETLRARVEGMVSGLQQLHAYWGEPYVASEAEALLSRMSLKRGEFENMKKLQSELQSKIQSRRTYTAGAHGGR